MYKFKDMCVDIHVDKPADMSVDIHVHRHMHRHMYRHLCRHVYRPVCRHVCIMMGGLWVLARLPYRTTWHKEHMTGTEVLKVPTIWLPS